jgi:gamma-glutamyltranspeptidase
LGASFERLFVSILAPPFVALSPFLSEQRSLIFWRSFTGGLAVGVPGTLAAAARLLEDHGTRSMDDVAAPAIDIARRCAISFTSGAVS